MVELFDYPIPGPGMKKAFPMSGMEMKSRHGFRSICIIVIVSMCFEDIKDCFGGI